MSYKVSVYTNSSRNHHTSWWRKFISSNYYRSIEESIELGNNDSLHYSLRMEQVNNIALAPWNASDLIFSNEIEFESEKDYTLFLLKWG